MTTFKRHRGVFLLSVTVLLSHLLPATVAAGISAPYLVGDFDPRRFPPTLRFARGFVPFGDRVVMPVNGDLWGTDGTAGGTERLFAGAPCILPDPEECPQDTFTVGGAAAPAGVFFGSGQRLWITDATIEGTLPLTDPPVRPEVLFSNHLLDPDRGLFYFAAQHPLTGTELWVSDGTRAGTRELGDLAPGPYSSSPRFGAVVGDRVVFSAADRDGDREPWVTDGTPEGTRLLREIVTGAGGSSPDDFHSLGDLAVFTAEDDLRGRELWVTDGTPEGTEPLPEVAPGPVEDFFAFFAEKSTPAGLFFFVRIADEWSLWITDGTPDGTRELRQLGPQPEFGLTGTTLRDRALVAFDDGTLGRELWVSDGTPEGTRLLRDLCPGVCSSFPGALQTFGTHVLFTARDEAVGREPWVSDGTPEGTRRLGDLSPGPDGTIASLLSGNDRRLFFRASTPRAERGLWVSEAPFLTARLLTDPETGNPSGLEATALLGDDLVGVALDAEHGVAVWRSDGSRAGTQPVRTLSEPEGGGSSPYGLSRVGDRVFFAIFGATPALWQTRGTPDTTLPVFVTPEGGPRQDFRSLTPLRDRLVFLLPDAEERLDLWASGGTPDTTGPVAEDVARFQASGPLPATTDRAFLLSEESRPGLWVTDGTADGTHRLPEIQTDGFVSPGIFQDRLFFSGDRTGGVGDFELWVSDGTPEGTMQLADLDPDGSSHPGQFTPVGDVLYFTAGDFTDRRLWVTDGTPEGTRRVELPPAATEEIGSFSALGDRLIFTSFLEAFSEPFGFTRYGLWSTDGTAEGTTQLGVLRSFGRLHDGLERAVVGEEMFFLGLFLDLRLVPVEIWRTDGTPEGTLPWRFLPPDRVPFDLQAVDSRLAIEADGPDGPELWWSGDLSSAELVGAFREVGDLTRLDDLVLFPGKGPQLGAELWAFEAGDFGILPPPTPPVGIPQTPDGLEVFANDSERLTVAWRDRSTNETSFVVQARDPTRPEFETVAVLPADRTQVRLVVRSELPMELRVRAENVNGASDWSAEASGRVFSDIQTCLPAEERLCLLNGRFEVRVHWRDALHSGHGTGHAVPFDFSDDSGTFWFFDPANVELVVKVLDARTVNGFHWAFYGALSNVEYWVTVADLLEGTSRTYHNPAGNLCGFGDTRAFPRPGPPPLASPDQTVPLVVIEEPEPTPPAAVSLGIAADGTGGDAGDCTESDTALCLTAERFRVEVEWRDPRSGDTGVGFAIPGTDDSGFFWFFDPENVELVVKVLDARTVNGHFWVFYGGLSDVEYTITVTDTVRGFVRTYRNEAFDICGQADTAAF